VSTTERQSTRPRRAPFVLLVLFLLGAGLCALLALNTAAAAAEVQQRSAATTNDQTQDRTAELQVDIANKQAPAALASAAQALGMVANPDPAFLVVRPNGSVIVMGSPAPVSAVSSPTPPSPDPSTKTSTVAIATLPGGAR
jgi:hypothetical protein